MQENVACDEHVLGAISTRRRRHLGYFYLCITSELSCQCHRAATTGKYTTELVSGFTHLHNYACIKTWEFCLATARDIAWHYVNEGEFADNSTANSTTTAAMRRRDRTDFLLITAGCITTTIKPQRLEYGMWLRRSSAANAPKICRRDYSSSRVARVVIGSPRFRPGDQQESRAKCRSVREALRSCRAKSDG